MNDINVKVEKNDFNFNLNDLVLIGKRANNEKRNFLFISKLLGKHLIVKPDICKATGILLSSLKYPEINNKNVVEYIKGKNINIKNDLTQSSNNKNKVLVIGFAETATGLGMSVASSINNCTYWTTTRENLIDIKNILTFEEEHCHATTHKMFSENHFSFNDYDEIILVDDEITTGKSMLNLINAIKNISNIKTFNIMTILDWRSQEYRNEYIKYTKENNIKINIYSIISGTAASTNTNVYKDNNIIKELTEITPIKDLNIITRKQFKTTNGIIDYILDSGRFGVSQADIIKLENTCKQIANSIKTNKKTLVLGHGENIYIPSRIASYLNADFKTTTRSPIYCDGEIIKTKYKFIDRDVTYYLYNKEDIEKEYEEIILITDTPLNIKLTKNIKIYKI